MAYAFSGLGARRVIAEIRPENRRSRRVAERLGMQVTGEFVKRYHGCLLYTSGCTAMCLYCYLVCHYNKCAYLRLFVNREQMLDRLSAASQKAPRPMTGLLYTSADW